MILFKILFIELQNSNGLHFYGLKVGQLYRTGIDSSVSFFFATPKIVRVRVYLPEHFCRVVEKCGLTQVK